MSLRPLPPYLGSVVVPECFSVAGVASCGGCRLRLVLASSASCTYRLPSGPDAAIGTLVHRVKERCALRSTPSLTPEEIFDSEYAALISDLESDIDRRHFAHLSETRSPSQWSMVRRRAIAQCSSSSALTRVMESEGPRARSHPNRAPRSGHEIELESQALRIRGRADSVEREGPDRWVVRDYKTGAVVDSGGDLRPEYVMQIRCYGLMIAEMAPTSDVRLILDDGEAHEVPFDDSARAEALEFVLGLIGTMPSAGSTGPASDLARPGSACATCPHRVVCAAYREQAPRWWRDHPTDIDHLPFDTWGRVLDVLHGQQISLMLEDDAGRRVKVDRLGSRHGLADVMKGHRLWLFSLNRVGIARGFDGRSFYPRNFFELPRDLREQRAWTVVAFVRPD